MKVCTDIEIIGKRGRSVNNWLLDVSEVVSTNKQNNNIEAIIDVQ